MKTRGDLFKRFLRLETRIENPEGPHLPEILGTLEEKMTAVQRRKAQEGDTKAQKALKKYSYNFETD